MLYHLSPLDTALIALLCFCIAGIWGTYIIAFISELAGKLTKRIFLDKFGLQMSRLATLIHAAFWIAMGGCAVLFIQTSTPLPSLVRTNSTILLATLGLGLLGSLLLFTYFGTWKKLKKNKKPLHMLLGLIGIICLKPLFWVAIITLRAGSMGMDTTLCNALPPVDSLLWPLGLKWAFLSISLSAVLGLLYLLIRRNRDDFGRDYYKYVLPVCAKWALFPFIIILPLCAWVYVIISPTVAVTSSLPLMAALGTRALTLLLAALLWVWVIRSATPLRLKGAILASMIFMWIFLMATTCALWDIIGVYSGLFIPQTFFNDLLVLCGVA